MSRWQWYWLSPLSLRSCPSESIPRKNTGSLPPHAEPVEETEKAPAPGSAGQVKLYDVEPKAAAMLMAIVAHKMGKPLNELRFLSIREVSPRSGRQSAQTK
jgi:3-oxoacyl-ACP reductase-like protein